MHWQLLLCQIVWADWAVQYNSTQIQHASLRGRTDGGVSHCVVTALFTLFFIELLDLCMEKNGGCCEQQEVGLKQRRGAFRVAVVMLGGCSPTMTGFVAWNYGTVICYWFCPSIDGPFDLAVRHRQSVRQGWMVVRPQPSVIPSIRGFERGGNTTVFGKY